MQKRITIVLLECILPLLLSLGAVGQVQETYKEQCSSCHAMDGSGSPAGKKLGVFDLRSHQVQSLSDDELFQTIAHGVGHKQYPHVFISRGLTAKQIVELVAFIRKFPKHG